MAKDFFDDVLIKLKREYQKDEILAAIIKENSKLIVEIGKLKSEMAKIKFNNNFKKKSEIQHLEYEIETKKEIDEKEIVEYKKKLTKEINKEIRLDNTIIQLKTHIKTQDKLIESLRKNISELIYQNIHKIEK